MHRLLGLVVFSCSACSFPAPLLDEGMPPLPDASPVDASLECVPGFLNLCAQADPIGSFELGSGSNSINTDRDRRCRTLKQVNGPDVCLLYFTDITVLNGDTLFAYGSRPLALVAKNTLEIAGIVDVASRRDRPPGAGSSPMEPSLCEVGTGPRRANGRGGGGAGGTFITRGGAGGSGDRNEAVASGGMPAPELDSSPTALRGGCRGQAGVGGASSSEAGLGGGAVYLAAATLRIQGSIYAGGNGAPWAGNLSGGGGGGSGGMIVLQGSRLDFASSVMIANGAGGSEGGDSDQPGDYGEDATTVGPAAGGAGSAGNGGRGGAGASSSGGANPGSDGVAGGGGGGGGAGYILLLGPEPSTAGAQISPAPVIRAQ